MKLIIAALIVALAIILSPIVLHEYQMTQCKENLAEWACHAKGIPE